jgi:hypothetical protein
MNLVCKTWKGDVSDRYYHSIKINNYIRTREIVLFRLELGRRVYAEVTSLIFVKDARKDRWRIEVGDAITFDYMACNEQVITKITLI